MNPNRLRPRPARRGYTLLEVAIAVLVVSTAMTMTVKVLGWVVHERRSSDRRQWAVLAASNVMERATSGPFDGVTADAVKALAARADAPRELPGADWEVAVVDDRDAPLPARRVTLRLRWKDRAGRWEAPVRLTSWVYRRGAAR